MSSSSSSFLSSTKQKPQQQQQKPPPYTCSAPLVAHRSYTCSIPAPPPYPHLALPYLTTTSTVKDTYQKLYGYLLPPPTAGGTTAESTCCSSSTRTNLPPLVIPNSSSSSSSSLQNYYYYFFSSQLHKDNNNNGSIMDTQESQQKELQKKKKELQQKEKELQKKKIKGEEQTPQLYYDDKEEEEPREAFRQVGDILWTFEIEQAHRRKRLRQKFQQDKSHVIEDSTDAVRPLTKHTLVLTDVKSHNWTLLDHDQPPPLLEEEDDQQKLHDDPLQRLSVYSLKEIVLRLIPYHVFHLQDQQPTIHTTTLHQEDQKEVDKAAKKLDDNDNMEDDALLRAVREDVCRIKETTDTKNPGTLINTWSSLRLLYEIHREVNNNMKKQIQQGREVIRKRYASISTPTSPMLAGFGPPAAAAAAAAAGMYAPSRPAVTTTMPTSPGSSLADHLPPTSIPLPPAFANWIGVRNPTTTNTTQHNTRPIRPQPGTWELAAGRPATRPDRTPMWPGALRGVTDDRMK